MKGRKFHIQYIFEFKEQKNRSQQRTPIIRNRIWTVLGPRTPRTERNRTRKEQLKKKEQEWNNLAGGPRSRTEQND